MSLMPSTASYSGDDGRVAIAQQAMRRDGWDMLNPCLRAAATGLGKHLEALDIDE